MTLRLGPPCLDWLPSYAHALETGWSPDNTQNVSAEQLAFLKCDPAAFLNSLLAQHGVVTLPDGSTRPKLPSLRLWLWDGEFCGTISMRWQEGSDALPPHVLGHIGYAVVPWKRSKGYASEAFRVMLNEARRIGLGRIEITVDRDNLASRRVIQKNGGHLIEEFVNEIFGPDIRLRYVVSVEDRSRGGA